MATQLITIDAAGSAETIRRKPGTGIDLRELGRVSMRRSSNIEMDEKEQAFFITFLEHRDQCYREDGILCAQDVFNHATSLGVNWKGCRKCPPDDPAAIVYFDEYEDAVPAEVEILQNMRFRN